MSDASKLEGALAKLVQDGAETGRILSAAERLLAGKPNHPMALQCKVVCCIYQERFGAAVAALDTLESSAGSRLPSGASANAKFQRAYCFYRMRRYAEAKSVLTSTSHGSLKDHIPSQHLLAQVHYNLEEFPAAAAIYKSLLDAGAYRDEEERTEMETNYAAVLASGTEPRQAVTVVQNAEDKTSDLVYNGATALIEAEDYAGAMKMLQQAESLYAQENPKSHVKCLADALALLNDEADGARVQVLSTPGTPERRFFSDVANTWLQMAYVKHATRDEAGAEAILSLVLAGKPSSVVTAAIASINWTAIHRHKDFANASKKLKSTQNEKVASRLTSRQNLLVRYNLALLHLNSGNLGSCRRLVEGMAKEHPESDLTQSLKLALAARETRGKASGAGGTSSATEAVLKAFMEKQAAASASSAASSSSASATLPLVAVQVYLENGDLARALEAFEAPALAEWANTPSGIATRAAWLVQLDRLSEAAQLVAAAVPQVKGVTTQKALLAWSVHAFGTQAGPQGNAQAVSLLKKARAASPALAADKETTAMLGLALATSEDRASLAEARDVLAGVLGTPGTSAAPSKKETESLVKKQPSRAAVEELGYHRKTLEIAAGGGDGPQEQRLKKRRARPMRRPPRVAPEKGKAPDPERWIPISMRSYIKDLPDRKKKELKRLRALEQEQKRRAAEKRKAEAAAGSTGGAAAAPAE